MNDSYLPSALVMGVSYETFWHLNPVRMKPIEKAYMTKMDARQARMNLEAWVHGIYIQHAVASVLSKSAKYPQKPLELFGTTKKTPQQEADEFKRFMLQHNAINRVNAEIKG